MMENFTQAWGTSGMHRKEGEADLLLFPRTSIKMSAKADFITRSLFWHVVCECVLTNFSI